MLLDLMRRKAQSPVLQAVIVIIVLVFIFWGVGSNQGNPQVTVAKVNDVSISLQEYQKTYDRIVTQYRDQFGGNLPRGFLDSLNLKDQALEQLIQQVLLHEAARKSGLEVSNFEMQETIAGMEAFQVNGAFDPSRYKAILSASRMNEAGFESSITNDLLNAKILQHISGFGKVSEEEIGARLHYDYDEYNVAFVKISPADFTDKVQPSADDLAGYFTENQQQYTTEPQVKLKYLSFLFADQEKNVLPLEEEIAEYYNRHQDAYNIPEKRQASHILLKVAEDAGADLLAEKRTQMENLLARAKAGEDFAALAQEFSEDGSSANGGDLGFFSRGQMVKPFEEAVFALEEGGISDIVQTRFGLHIIKVTAVQPATLNPQEKVREKIILSLQQEKGAALTLAAANAAYEQIILSGSLEKYGADHDASLKETDFFDNKTAPEDLAGEYDVISNAFSLQKGELSSLIKTDKGYYIVYLADLKAPEVPALDMVVDQVRTDFIAARALELAKEAASGLLARVREGAAFDQEVEALGKTTELSGFLSRRQPGSKLPGSVASQVFELSEAKPYPAEIGNSGNDFYVIRFAEKKEANPETLAEKKDEIKNRLLSEKGNLILTSWLAFLQDKAVIKKDEKYL